MVSVFRYAIHILCLGLLLACSLNQFPDSTIANGIYSSHKIELVEIENDRSAHWLKADLLVLPEFNPDYSYDLVRSDNQESLALVQDERLNWHQNFPHLNDFQAFKITLTKDEARNWLKALPFVVVKNKDEQVVKVSYAQTGFVLDDLYTGSGNDADEINDLGAVVDSDGVSFKLWAPTAENVTVLLFDKNKNPAAQRSLQMIEDPQTGVWSALGDSSLEFAYYQYQIRLFHYVTGNLETLVTTDPYSLSLSTNSEYSQVIDLDNKDTKPAGWDNQAIPTVKNPEDNIFYEVHIRDFSSADTSLSDATRRGKYKAFSERESAGIKHLKSLRASGLNNIHLLPTFDIGTVEEDQANVIDLHDPLEKVCQIASAISICQNSFDKNTTLYVLLKSFDPLSEKAQALITEVKQFDNYNWGYDPYHYTVPEGSYALNPEGQVRILEFREMVQTLHELGFRVIMDVVYNHTHQAGLDQKSVLDKIVPGYYHRLHPVTGAIEQSTCCDNTATERRMMAKLMTDSLRVWADNYKIDGFRFDLMGHQPKGVMLTARDAVRDVDPDTYFYGEGWDFGEVANNQRFVQASQLELGGSEIGTFSDRMRDAVRGCCFNSEGSEIRRQQGIGNGLGVMPNELAADGAKSEYFTRLDHLRLGLVGNLANFTLMNIDGVQLLGKDILYGSDSAAYALDPADTINYVSKHDNQTLWDNNQYRNAFELSREKRVRMHNQSLSFVLLAQGIPFIHMGSELLRSKSFLRDSYDYADWFNRVDFSMQDNFYHIGLPPAEKDQVNWPLIRNIIQKNQGKDQVGSKEIKFSYGIFKEFLAIRAGMPHFRLSTSDQILEKVQFHNTGEKQQKGLIVMSITGENENVLVIFNFSNKSQFFSFKNSNNYHLHPVQITGIDKVVKQSFASSHGFTVPGLTTAVFVTD